MSYFKNIYNAAIKKDKESLKASLAKGACIDEREKNENFSTPAGRLAREGNIEAANWLINNFGANIEFVIEGYLKSDHAEEAKKLCDKYKIDFNVKKAGKMPVLADYDYTYVHVDQPRKAHVDHLRAILAAGDMNFSHHLANRFNKKLRNDFIIQYAMHGGHLYYVEKLYSRSNKLPADFAQWLGVKPIARMPIGNTSCRFTTPELALHSLSFVNNSAFIDKIVQAVESTFKDGLPYDISSIAVKAKQINKLMKTYGFDYPAALDSVEPVKSNNNVSVADNKNSLFAPKQMLKSANEEKKSPDNLYKRMCAIQ